MSPDARTRMPLPLNRCAVGAAKGVDGELDDAVASAAVIRLNGCDVVMVGRGGTWNGAVSAA